MAQEHGGRLTRRDASLLEMESPIQLMHGGGVFVLDPPPDGQLDFQRFLGLELTGSTPPALHAFGAPMVGARPYSLPVDNVPVGFGFTADGSARPDRQMRGAGS